jgi:hypothetical protein
MAHQKINIKGLLNRRKNAFMNVSVSSMSKLKEKEQQLQDTINEIDKNY